MGNYDILLILPVESGGLYILHKVVYVHFQNRIREDLFLDALDSVHGCGMILAEYGSDLREGKAQHLSYDEHGDLSGVGDLFFSVVRLQILCGDLEKSGALIHDIVGGRRFVVPGTVFPKGCLSQIHSDLTVDKALVCGDPVEGAFQLTNVGFYLFTYKV